MFRTTVAALSLAFAGVPALADGPSSRGVDVEVTITNLTAGQSFTPQFLATHAGRAPLFEIGAPASWELEQLAEGGATDPLEALYVNDSEDVRTIAVLLGPGQTSATTLRAPGGRQYLTMAAMLLPTNDTFVGISGMPIPASGSVTYMVPAYDAGTEANDQDCANIPGPMCGGDAVSEPAPGDEGFVHISGGFHELGGDALSPAHYDWRNPVARVVVKRLR